MTVLAAPQNRVGRITNGDDFQRKERCGGMVRSGGSTTSEWKGTNRTGWDGEEYPGIETENEKLKRTIPFWRALLRVFLGG